MARAGGLTDGRMVRAARQRQDRREQVLTCAQRVFSRRGYHDTGVADIIAEAGVARGTFYLYFESKRAIFDELLDRLLGLIVRSVRRIEVGPGAPPALEQMLGQVRDVVGTLQSHTELTRILFKTAIGIDADFDRKLDEFYGRLRDMIKGAVVLGAEMQLVRPCDADVASLCALGSLKEVMEHYLVRGAGRAFDRERVSREILEYNLKGLFR
jgi:AcrR family transcriptional regulator